MDPHHTWKPANCGIRLQVERVCCPGVSAGWGSVPTIVEPGDGWIPCMAQ
jgi:hypothetical protein